MTISKETDDSNWEDLKQDWIKNWPWDESQRLEKESILVDSVVCPGEKLELIAIYRESDKNKKLGYSLSSTFATCNFCRTDDGWEVQFITSDQAGEGTRILKEFAHYIGKNQKIFSTAIEDATEEKLVELGYGEMVKGGGEVVITDPEIFAVLKTTRRHTRVGIVNDKLVITENTDSKFPCPIEVSFYGHT